MICLGANLQYCNILDFIQTFLFSWLGKSKLIRYIDNDSKISMHKKEQFEELFKNNYKQMLRLSMLIIKDEEESKDIVSDIFTEIGRASCRERV